MILEAKIDNKNAFENRMDFGKHFDAFCFILDFILDQKRLQNFDLIWWKNSKSSPADPTPQIYTTGAVYKSGGTPGEVLGRGKNNNM